MLYICMYVNMGQLTIVIDKIAIRQPRAEHLALKAEGRVNS